MTHSDGDQSRGIIAAAAVSAEPQDGMGLKSKLELSANKNRFKIFAAAEFRICCAAAAAQPVNAELSRPHNNAAYIIGTEGV